MAIYSLQDWFFRVEFVNARLDGETVAKVLDSGAACEDHIVLVDANRVTTQEMMRTILVHEFRHAVERYLARRRPITPSE